MFWLHDSAGYSFHGDAPITGLTPHEVNALMLGHRVHNGQRDDAGGASASGDFGDLKRQVRRRRDEIHDGRARRDLGFD